MFYFKNLQVINRSVFISATSFYVRPIYIMGHTQEQNSWWNKCLLSIILLKTLKMYENVQKNARTNLLNLTVFLRSNDILLSSIFSYQLNVSNRFLTAINMHNGFCQKNVFIFFRNEAKRLNLTSSLFHNHVGFRCSTWVTGYSLNCSIV